MSGSTYIACLPGGWIGDRLLGSAARGADRRHHHHARSSAARHRALDAVFFLGLLMIVLGTGLLKPNTSAIVAQLYPEGGARRDAGFTIYYIGVNVGGDPRSADRRLAGGAAAMAGRAGFMSAAVGMAAGVLQFLWGTPLLGDAGRAPMSGDSAQRAQGCPPRAALRWIALARCCSR
jgi:POT family proton-dependent oligopeptide transporter